MYKELLTEWCDALLRLQVDNPAEPRLHGGILCPACMRIHGRSGDAVLPLVTMAALTGDHKYLDSAKRLFDWSEHMVRPDGSYNNDTNSWWNGITVFAAIQLGETLLLHGGLLDPGTKEKWLHRFTVSSEYLLNHIEEIGGNINYPITCAHAMAVAWKLLGREEFAEKARALARSACGYILESGLLFGEGHPRDAVTPKGCRPVDLGYNVEESLPALLSYAVLMEDSETLQKATDAILTHLEFMMLDGGWDNSWGSRSFKWSYWGSRTSDGCQPGFALLAKSHPVIGEAVRRNTALLLACTHDGLLYGGPMYYSAGEPPCVHHTICHAKALAQLVESGFPEQGPAAALPCEDREGIQWYPDIQVAKLVKRRWHATVSGYDYVYAEGGHPTGGSITLLWHRLAGPLLAGTMSRYIQVEPNNMQTPRYQYDINQTPRIELKQDRHVYSSSNDLTAHVVLGEDEEALWSRAAGKLRSENQAEAGDFRLEYRIGAGGFQIEGMSGAKGSRYLLPIIADDAAKIFWNHEREAVIALKKCEIRLKASLPIEIPSEYRLADGGIRRRFHPVGGFMTVPFTLALEPDVPFILSLEIEDCVK